MVNAEQHNSETQTVTSHGYQVHAASERGSSSQDAPDLTHTAPPFVSESESPFNGDEVILVDEWVQSRFYDTASEAEDGILQLLSSTGANFAYAFSVYRRSFDLEGYQYWRYSFSARVGLYVIGTTLVSGPDSQDVENRLHRQLDIHHASRKLDLMSKQPLSHLHLTLMSIAAAALLCAAFHGVMTGWLIGQP